MHNVAIIGAGPIGLELHVALKRAGVADVLHLDAGQIGHTVSWFPNQTRFFSSPERIALCGVPLQTADQTKATREEYLAYLRALVKQFDVVVNTYERVVELTPPPAGGDGPFVIRTHKAKAENVYQARHVVLAVGDMARPRLLHIPGEDLPHVNHYFEDPHPYFGQNLLIVGGKNSAVEAAIRCFRVGTNVTLSYRGAEFDKSAVKYWLSPEIDWLIGRGQIKFHPLTEPVAITPSHVTLRPVDGGEPFDVPADFVLLMTGYVADMTLFKMAGVPLDGDAQAPAFDPDTMQTPTPRLFVAGTSAAGTQHRFRLFIENCHHHVVRIVKAITGKDTTDVNPLAFGRLKKEVTKEDEGGLEN